MSPLEKLDYLTKEKQKLENESRTFRRFDLERVEEKIKDCQVEIKRSKEIFDEAVKAGSVPINTRNVLIQGNAGVGKTSAKCILFDQLHPEVRTSTPLAESLIARHIRHISGVKVQSQGSEWKPVKNEDLQQIVVDVISAIARKIKSGDDVNVQTQLQNLLVSAPEDTSLQQPSTQTQSTGESSLAMSTTDASALHGTPDSVDYSSLPDDSQSVIANIHGQMVDLVAKEEIVENRFQFRTVRSSRRTHQRTPREILGSNWIYFIDSGGQPHFHNLLPHFIHGISIALFALRLSERLDGFPMVEYYEEGQSIAAPYRSPLTTEDTLKFLVRSMQSHTVDGEKPKLTFIGTFLDKIGDCTETLAEKNERLLELLNPEFRDQLVFFNEAMNELILPLDAKHPGDHEKRIAELIRSAVETSPSKLVVTPIWWYVLEISLEKLSEHLGRRVLSKQECLEVAHQLKISPDALDEALKFFHEQHTFHHYPLILPDVVFTSSQVLLDKLTELVKHAYLMREAVKNPSATTADSCTLKKGEWLKFRDEGIITLEFLQYFNRHYVDKLFSPSDLLKVFMIHLILTPFSAKLHVHEVVDFTSRKAQYYMPSLLDMLSPTELEKYRIFSSVYPLLIRFPNGWPRAGVFCCLQVYLIQRLGWKLVLVRGKPKLIAQNCVMLSPPNSACSVILIDSFSYLEVHVKATASVCCRVCPSIRDAVLHGINASCKTLRYSNDQPHLAFFCPCELSSPASSSTATDTSSLPRRHAAELLRKDHCLRCTVDETTFSELKDEHKIWFQGKRMDTSPAPLPSPTIDDLLSRSGLTSNAIDKECSGDHILEIYGQLEKWEEVAAHLGLSSAEIKAVKSDSDGVELMRLNALKKWKSVYVYKATYRVLLEALCKTGCTELASQVCKLLSQELHMH